MIRTMKKHLGLSALLIALAATPVAANLPEPSNLIFGTVSLDGLVVTSDNNNVSLVLMSGDQKIASYFMGDNITIGNRYLLEVPLSAIVGTTNSVTKKGDSLSIHYRVGQVDLAVAQIEVGARGKTTELNLTLSTEVVDAATSTSPVVDSDGDGIPDSVEVALGLNPTQSSDALLDSDGDGVSNLQEYVNGTNALLDDVPPVLTVPVSKTFNAHALFTEVDLGVATAVDALDGNVLPTADGDRFYAPGEHIVTWTARDAAGNKSTDTQIIKVIPMVGFSADQLTAEGNSVTLTALLNGNAIEYPITIPYTVSGTASGGGVDFTLADSEIIINSGLSASVTFPVVLDAFNDEGDETIIVAMGTPTNAVVGSHDVFEAQIIEGNIAPSVTMIADQGNGQTAIIESDGGTVTITISVDDPNINDVHTYDWSLTDNVLADTDGDVTDESFIFDPFGLIEGTYVISLTVTDASAAIGNIDLLLRVVNEAPVLAAVDTDSDNINDEIEGFGDSDSDGIANYLDAIALTNVIQGIDITFSHHLLEAETGLNLFLGLVAVNVGARSVSVGISDIESAFNTTSDITVDKYYRLGGVFDFSISGLTKAGDSVYIVIPQFEPIAKSAVYSNFLSPSLGWSDFIVDINNVLSSALGTDGYCPSPGDSAYSIGLTEGNWCVQLLIEDGGPNDADNLANKTINNLGAIATLTAPTVTSSSSGGGGSFYPLFLLLICLVGLVHIRRIFISKIFVP